MDRETAARRFAEADLRWDDEADSTDDPELCAKLTDEMEAALVAYRAARKHEVTA